MENIIYKTEQLYNNKKNKTRLLILINRYYLAFLNYEDNIYLEKAYSAIKLYLEENKSDLDMILAICFFAFKKDDTKNAKYYLDIIEKFKKYLKNVSPIKYAFYIYLLFLEKGKISAKHIKTLTALNKEKLKEIDIIILNIKYESGTLERDSLEIYKDFGKNSFYLNLVLYQIFNKSPKFLSFNKTIFSNHIKWAYKNSLDITNSMNKYKKYIDFEPKDNLFNINFYKKYNSELILEKICTKYIYENILTEHALFFYKEAINRQLDIENLNIRYIKACYKFNFEEIPIYPIKCILKENDLENDLSAFIYYIMLTNNKYKILALENKENILQKGIYFLETKCVGKYYYAIYKYLLLNLEQSHNQLKKQIIQMLYPIYYSYDITVFNRNAKFIFIKDKEINTIQKHELIDSKVSLKAISDNFYYYIFDYKNKEILHSEVKIEKVINSTSTKISINFLENGYKDKYTLINSAKYFLNYEKLTIEEIQFFLEVLKIEDLAPSFKAKILQLVGNNYFYNNDYETAIKYYKNVLDKDINYKYIDNILICYIKTLHHENAIEIIKKMSHLTSENVLYTCLKTLTESDKFDIQLVPFIYEMLLKSKIDNLFIDIVIKHYKGSLKEWIQLRNILKESGMLKKQLDELIIKITIYTHNLNKESEMVFISFYAFNKENDTAKIFLEYCIYEGIFNKYQFLEDTVTLIEDIFFKTNDKYLGYLLAHIYLNNGYDLIQKDEILAKIISDMENNGINFEIFEKNKDKFKKYPYIFKNTPFIHKMPPKKEVFMHFRVSKDAEFKRVKMKYFKFGLYICVIPTFFNEELEYYFEEGISTGSIYSERYLFKNTFKQVLDIDDEYFKINNGLIYNFEGKYHLLHDLIEKHILKEYAFNGKIL